MIINELNKYYEILAEDGKSGIPLSGYSSAKVGFALNISEKGELLDVIPLKVEVDKKNKLISRMLIVPEQKDHGVKISPNFMCDNSTYVLGVDNKGKPERSKEAFNAFKELHYQVLNYANGQAAKAILSFLDNWNIDDTRYHSALENYLKEILEGSKLVFMLDGKLGYLHDDLEIKMLWENYNLISEDDKLGQCLVTGEKTSIARTHTFIKNVNGTKNNSGSLISFNDQSYESYGKTQSYNSPISKSSVFKYTTVLNHMLSSQKQKIQIGDATTVFWAESPEDIYIDLAAELFNPSSSRDREDSKEVYRRDPQIEELVKDILFKAKSGQKINSLDGKINNRTKFHILGLSPNASRISIRYFHSDSYGSFLDKTLQHYKDMEIVKDFNDRPDNIPIWMMLRETVSPKSSDKEASPLIAGAIMRSIISGAAYPASLFNAVIIRIKVDSENNRVNYIRAAIIKAYLLRNARIHNNKKLEEVLTVSLNELSTNTEYLLGRLFAVLEKAQQDANPGINATIKDRYFASACATPASVFPILLRLAQHHISKSDYGYAIDRKIEPIMNEIGKFPSHLTLEQQGTFVLGYYHQRVALYQKSEKENTNN